MKAEMYEEINQTILDLLAQGVVPWQMPWFGGKDGSLQSVDGHKYRGVNVWLLFAACLKHGYTDPRWVTFKRAKELGGSVRKGEKATKIVLYRFFEAKDASDGSNAEPKGRCVARWFSIFNVAQCDWEKPLDTPADHDPIAPLEACESIVANMPQRPEIVGAVGGCFYRKSTDTVHMIPIESFKSQEGYYGTLFHELAHATGHASRLGRESLTTAAAFGSEEYSQEELVAELASAYVCVGVGILPAKPTNTAAYIQGWMRKIKESKNAFAQAAAQAQRAADWILNTRQDRDVKSEDSTDE
jgi:antirestriction protein ArdC